MDPALIPDGFASPADTLLCELEHDGFAVELTDDGALSIAPRSRLTPERMHVIADHKDALRQLLRGRDAGVIARCTAFAEQLARTPAPRVPAFLFREGVEYAKGRCFSCGDALPQPTFGRCWRCSVAWRLACKLPIPPDLATALDNAKVIA